MSDSKRRNAGFSLVELIIVIAIMVVLVGVLAPQFVKYVEKSRIGTDVTNAQEIAAGIAAAIADPDFEAGVQDSFGGTSGKTFKSGDAVPSQSGEYLIQGMDKFPGVKAKIAGTGAYWKTKVTAKDSVEVYIVTGTNPSGHKADNSSFGSGEEIQVYPTANDYNK